MPYNNNHHNRSFLSSRHSDTTIEQLYPTTQPVPIAQHTNNAEPAWSTRIHTLNTDKIGISRLSAPQPARPTMEWGIGTPTHIQQLQSNGNSLPHKPQVVPLIHFDTNPNKNPCINTTRANTGQQTYTSGPTSGRGDTRIKPDKTYSLFMHPQRPFRGVRQDKGVLTNAASASSQPAPDTKGIRVQCPNNTVVRTQGLSEGKQHSGRLTIWGIDPALMQAFLRIAAEEGLSLSQAGKTAISQWVHQSLHDRHEALLYPILRQLIRDELTAFGNRIIFFLMRIAFAAEQTRILVTNILSRFLKYIGVPDETFNSLVDKSNRMAKRNIIARTPQIKTLMQEWWQSSYPSENPTDSPDNKPKPNRKEDTYN